LEEIETRPEETLNAKFRRILKEYSPSLFLILVSQELGATGASYEGALLINGFPCVAAAWAVILLSILAAP